jgi:hypothetical protein
MKEILCGLCDLGGERFLCLNDFAAAQARRADADPLALAVDLGVHRAQVDVPASLGDVVGVADAVSRLRLLAADITLLCHDCSRFLMGLYAKLLFYRTNALSANPQSGVDLGWLGSVATDLLVQGYNRCVNRKKNP